MAWLHESETAFGQVPALSTAFSSFIRNFDGGRVYDSQQYAGLFEGGKWDLGSSPLDTENKLFTGNMQWFYNAEIRTENMVLRSKLTLREMNEPISVDYFPSCTHGLIVVRVSGQDKW